MSEQTQPAFQKGNQYTRQDVYNILAVPEARQRGNFNTGYNNYENEMYVFCNIGVAASTGEDFDNRWDENGNLIWYTKRRASEGHPEVDLLLGNTIPKHIFTRTDNRDAFTYQGVGAAISSSGERPVEIIWQLS